jgi:hypothetical protein
MENLYSKINKLDAHLSNSKDALGMIRKLIMGLIEAQTVNMKAVCARFKQGTSESNYRAIQRFFEKKTLQDEDVIDFIMSTLFDENQDVILAIDRTEWAFGKTWHNLLVVSVVYENTAIPLIIKPLERRGNSHTDQRQDVMDVLLKKIPLWRIKSVLGDREFVGEKWLSYLVSEQIPFVMRMRENITVSDDNDCLLIKEFIDKTDGIYDGMVHIGTTQLRLCSKPIRKENLVVISQGVDDPLELYRQRWHIETGFKCLKTKGFNLEDTHFRDPIRLKTLVQICAITMSILMKSLPQVEYKKIRDSKKNTVIDQTHCF